MSSIHLMLIYIPTVIGFSQRQEVYKLATRPFEPIDVQQHDNGPFSGVKGKYTAAASAVMSGAVLKPAPIEELSAEFNGGFSFGRTVMEEQELRAPPRVPLLLEAVLQMQRAAARRPAGRNLMEHEPPDPLVELLLSHYGKYLPRSVGAPPGLYSYMAANNLHNNKPFGFYKLTHDP